MQENEGKACAIACLHSAVDYYARLGVTIRRILTDNGAAFRSRDFARACHALGVRHRFTKPYCLQTNGKAERFIGSALREWAYGFIYHHSGSENRHASPLDASLQLASAASWHRWCAACFQASGE